MNTFSENPLFLFVDELADGSANFATERKIVELFDTGCDARTPGGAFKISKGPDAIIQNRGSTPIPNVRKPFSLSLRQDKTQVKKNTCPTGTEHKRQNITGTCKSPEQSKPMTWKPKLKDKVSIKSDGIEVKTGLDPAVGNQSDGNNSQYSKRIGVSPEQHKAKSNVTHNWMFSKYGGHNRTEKLQSISSSIPKQYKAPEARQTICSTFEGRAKISSTKSVTKPRMTSPTKTSKVTSEASLNHGVKDFVNRAVDKDSLSNCSRQLEMAKTFGASSFSKTSYASRLPRSATAGKMFLKAKPPSKSDALIGTGKEAAIKPESKIASMKIARGTNHELQDKGMRNKAMKTATTVSLERRGDRLEGETVSKVTVNASPVLISQKKHDFDVKAKSSTKPRDLDDRNPITLSSSRSKTTASKMPLPRFDKNLLIGDKSVQRLGHPDKVSEVSDGQKSKSNGGLLSKIDGSDVARKRDSDNKLLASERPATYSEKVPARPSAKNHNLTSRETDANSTLTSFQTKFSKPRIPSIVPKLMDEFRLQEKKENEVSKCSSKSLAVRSVSPEAKTGSGKTETHLNGKSSGTFGLVSDHLKEPLSRFSDRVQQVLSSKTPLLDEVNKCMGTNHPRIDHAEQNRSKVDKESLTLSGVKAVYENDEEVELRTIFEDTPVPASREPIPESSARFLKASNTKESKLRHPPLCSLASGSKVPRPVVTKCILRKETARNCSDRKWPKKQELSTVRGPTKNSVRSEVNTEAKNSTPPTKKCVEHVPGSKNISNTSDVTGKDEDEDVIPIMNPALYNIHSFATEYRKRCNLENAVPQKTVHRGKIESWIYGHEQAYLKGRAIGLKVASMAQAAKEDLHREFVRSALKSTTPMSMPDKSQEIVDIGVSVIEKVLAEKENKIHSSLVPGDQVSNYHDFDKGTKWNSGQWLM